MNEAKRNEDTMDSLVRKLGYVPCPFCGEGAPYRFTIECGGFDSIERGAWRCDRCGAMGPECVSTWQDGLEKWNHRIANVDIERPMKPQEGRLT